VKILFEDLYLNLTSKMSIHRVYSFIFYNNQQLDGRYFSALILSSGQFNRINSLQNPLNYISNQIPVDVIQQRDVQQITFTGKVSQTLAQSALIDYWQNPVRQGLINANVYIIQVQQYLVYSIK